MSFQVCVNCGEGRPGYPHPASCPGPKYVGEPDRPAQGHTPAPWTFERHPSGSQYFGNIIGHYTPGIIRTITCQLRYGTPEEQEANARLIAAAPELLEACKAALPHLADLVARTCGEAKEFGGSFADRIAYDKVEAAIQKAEAAGVRS